MLFVIFIINYIFYNSLINIQKTQVRKILFDLVSSNPHFNACNIFCFRSWGSRFVHNMDHTKLWILKWMKTESDESRQGIEVNVGESRTRS